MTITQEELGRRISAARQEVGLSQAYLAEKIGIERSALSRIEAGKRGVDSLELYRLAEVLGKNLSYFVEPQTNFSVRFRAEAQANPKASKCLEKIEQLNNDYKFLLGFKRNEPLPGFDLDEQWPAFRGNFVTQATRAAAYVRDWLNLGDGAVDIFHFFQDLPGILFLRLPLGEDSIDGCFAYDGQNALIAINTDFPESRQRFTAAHEFGHYLFDKSDSLVVDFDVLHDTNEVKEKRANAFAANFLAPLEGIHRFMNQESAVTPEMFTHLQWHFGLSFEATIWRLVDAGYFKRDKAADWKNRFSNQTLAFRFGYGSQLISEAKERGSTFLPGRFESLAIGAFESGKISFERLAEMLWQDDLDDFKRKLDDAEIHAPDVTINDIKREARAD